MTFIYSLQTFPFIFFPLLIAEKFGVEFPFVISENASAVTDILLLTVIPILVNISFWKKILWILTNYIFLLLFCYFQSLVLVENPEIKLVQDKIEYPTPLAEFREFESKYKDSDLLMSDRFFLIYYKRTETEKRVYPQFCSLPLLDKIVENENKILKEAQLKTKRLFNDNDTTGAVLKEVKFKTFTSDQFKIRIKLDKNELFHKSTLDSFRHSYNKIYYADLKLTDSFMKHAKFKENRKLFKLYNQNLKLFDSIYTSEKFVHRMIYETKYYGKVDVNDGGIILLYEYSASTKNNFIRLQKKRLLSQNDKILNNFENYIFIKKYLYFPFFYFGKKEPLEKQYKYIKVK
ncbi:hypothetical protein [Flavobacterium johnsoniae]|uniref:hypothetical protein n=1 Tax=Flavobacterium johnsoniae TaxID=986 RepID=UPI003D985D76